jgi:hypothetical protein
MSDTPRTDSVYWTDSEAECEVVSREFAEQLERELSDALNRLRFFESIQFSEVSEGTNNAEVA